jgi:hypothetical protein
LLVAKLLPTQELKDKLVYQLFDTVMVDRIICSSCSHSEDRPATTANTYLLYVAKVLEAAHALGEKPFDTLIGATNQQDTISCPKCSKEAVIAKRLKSLPATYTVSLVWDSSKPRRTTLNDLFNAVSMEIDLKNICAVDVKGIKSKTTKYRFLGMILYYGRHYTAVFYHPSMKRWLRFDDSRVDPVGRYWHEVTDWCVQSRFQPSVLFYEREIATQTYYEASPEDIVPRLLKIQSPNRSDSAGFGSPGSASSSLAGVLDPVCPSLEGPVYKKNKKQWIPHWLKLNEWTLSFFDRPQKKFAVQYNKWVQVRRDPPILVLPVASIQSAEQDPASHNFSKKPLYMKIMAVSDDSATQTAMEYTLFIEYEAPFVQWLSALNQATEILSKTQKNSGRTKSIIIDNAIYSTSEATGGNSSTFGTADASALEFAPNASLDDLRRIAEMESGSPRGEPLSDEEEDQKITILHGHPQPVAVVVAAAAASSSSTINHIIHPANNHVAPVVPNVAPNGNPPKFIDPFAD